jgi:hypothetical protein
MFSGKNPQENAENEVSVALYDEISSRTISWNFWHFLCLESF